VSFGAIDGESSVVDQVGLHDRGHVVDDDLLALELRAKIPWYRTEWILGGGTRGASRTRSSSGSRTRKRESSRGRFIRVHERSVLSLREPSKREWRSCSATG